MYSRFEKINKNYFIAFILCITMITVLFSSSALAKHHKKKHKFRKNQLGTLVNIRHGWVEGIEDGSDTWSWQGIPYAKPPIGDLRWKAPQSPEPWEGILETKKFCNKCAQIDYYGEFQGSEDCLYLTVWRPATQQRNLPVYVYIHGGGNWGGSASESTYYGSQLASNANMVVVTINYRLGLMGWFINESIQDGDPLNDSGNYGMVDIIHALKWVKRNIKKFGGNPGNVTVAGQSAGAYNVCALIISPIARGLFHKAISQSGGFRLRSKEEGLLYADTVISDIIDDDPEAYPEDYDEPSEYDALADYLRSKSAEEILVYQGYNTIPANIDGVVIHCDGAEALNNPENYNQVPTILGTNKEEYKTLMTSTYFNPYNESEYQSIATLLSMQWRKTGVDDIATVMSSHISQPNIYAYSFDYGAYHEEGFNAWPTHVYMPNPGGDYANLAIVLGAGHSYDIPFYFNVWDTLPLSDLIFCERNYPGYELLSEAMVSYLAF
ncbi:MAG: carboxylesterase family protein, partial [Desulfobacteraceae bacterium]